MFYVYVLFRPWDMTPCYVGKGKGDRVDDHYKHRNCHVNRHLVAIMKKAGAPLPHEIVFRTEDEQAAFSKEIELIKQYGRADLGEGCLCNMTDGGDGLTGWVPTEETRRKIGLAQSGKRATAETRALMSAQRRGIPKSEEHKRRIGEKSLGRRHTPETIEKLRSARQSESEDRRRKALAYHSSLTPEQKAARAAKIVAGMKSARLKGV